MTSGTDEMHFFYDAQNRPAVVVYNGRAYAYVKSLQGDIVAILDENGNAVVSYGYDAWGAPLWCTGELAETLGKVQPFRYRGYVFDEETGLYYLRSRFYSPSINRFTNCDSEFDANSGLLCASQYIYCANNPIVFMDELGKGLIIACVIGFGVLGAIIGGVYAAKESEDELGYIDGWRVAGGVIIGGAIGCAAGACVGVAAELTCAFAEEVISSASLFGEQAVRSSGHLIQLLRKYYESSKRPLSLPMVKELIRLCDELGVEYSAHLNDLINVVNHKTWDGIPHIHIGVSRIHVAIEPEAIEFIIELLNLGGK